MKTMTKSVLILIITFFLGVITGAVVQGFMMREKRDKFSRRMRTPEGFIHRFEEIIEPTDEQRKEIIKVLKKHHQEMTRFQREFPARMDSLRKDLEKILTEEQKGKLKDIRWLRQKREFHRDSYDRHRHSLRDSLRLPPPPPPPPPEIIE